MFQICGNVEVVGFPSQNIYKMTYGDENVTFEPLNLWTHERLQYFLAFVIWHSFEIWALKFDIK